MSLAQEKTKIQNSKFKVLFLLNVHFFHTIISQKILSQTTVSQGLSVLNKLIELIHP